MKKFILALLALLATINVASAAMTADEIYKLNHMNATAYSTQLGTILATVEQTANRAVSSGSVAAVVKYAGTSPSENDSDASVVISAPGVLATDFVVATIRAQSGTAYILKAVPTTDTITVTLSGNGGAGTQIDWAASRAP